MKVVNYWEQFVSSGKIDDYLAYREEDDADRPEKDKGAGESAGTDQCYRDGVKNRTDW